MNKLLGGVTGVIFVKGSSNGQKAAVRSLGFSLIELLVVIVVISILIAIMIPALGWAKKAAVKSRSLSNQRQLLAATSMYSGDNSDYFPYLATPGEPAGPLWVGDFELPSTYFRGTAWFWTSLLVPSYFTQRTAIETEEARESSAGMGWPQTVVRSHYFLTNTTSAVPSYWDGDEPPDDVSLFRGTRQADVVHPTQKGLIVDISLGALANPDDSQGGKESAFSVGLADGSAGLRVWRGADLEIAVQRPFGSLPWHVFATRGGLAGRDF